MSSNPYSETPSSDESIKRGSLNNENAANERVSKTNTKDDNIENQLFDIAKDKSDSDSDH